MILDVEDIIELLAQLPINAIVTGAITICRPGQTDITITLRDPTIVLKEADEGIPKPPL